MSWRGERHSKYRKCSTWNSSWHTWWQWRGHDVAEWGNDEEKHNESWGRTESAHQNQSAAPSTPLEAPGTPPDKFSQVSLATSNPRIPATPSNPTSALMQYSSLGQQSLGMPGQPSTGIPSHPSFRIPGQLSLGIPGQSSLAIPGQPSRGISGPSLGIAGMENVEFARGTEWPGYEIRGFADLGLDGVYVRHAEAKFSLVGPALDGSFCSTSTFWNRNAPRERPVFMYWQFFKDHHAICPQFSTDGVDYWSLVKSGGSIGESGPGLAFFQHERKQWFEHNGEEFVPCKISFRNCSQNELSSLAPTPVLPKTAVRDFDFMPTCRTPTFNTGLRTHPNLLKNNLPRTHPNLLKKDLPRTPRPCTASAPSTAPQLVKTEIPAALGTNPEVKSELVVASTRSCTGIKQEQVMVKTEIPELPNQPNIKFEVIEILSETDDDETDLDKLLRNSLNS